MSSLIGQCVHKSVCHFGGKRTYERIVQSGLTWVGSSASKSVRADSIQYAATCETCQLHARSLCFDHVPIHVTDRETCVFRQMEMDVMGPLLPNVKLKFNFALVVVCKATRYPFAYALRTPNTKTIIDALLKMFELTGIVREMILISDNATYNKSSLMKEFVKLMGITPRFFFTIPS